MVTPTIYRKLRTNDPPTSQEAAVVRVAMEGSLNKLRTIEAETARLQKRLIALCENKKDTEDFVETHQGLLSPVRQLHHDILQEIFYQCLPTAHNSVLDPEVAPLVLGRVCSSWRQVAYSTPKLWSSLHIVAIPSSFYRAQARFSAISAWLSRSGALPLSISMSASGFRRGCGRRFTPINDKVQSYMNLILTYAKRWKCIHLSLLPYDWSTFFDLVNASDLPLLEALHIEGDLVRGRDPMSLDITPPSRKGGILFSPQLHVLSLPDYSQRLLDLPVSWGQLTALNLSRRILPLQDIIQIFTLCPELKVCSVSVSTPDQQSFLTNASIIPSIILPNLRTLKVIGKSGLNDNMILLLDKLTTPTLRHFTYERPVNAHTYPFRSESQTSEPVRLMKTLCSFFQRLNESLEEFDYWSNTLTRRGMMEVLSFVPGLKRLSLKDFPLYFMTGYDSDDYLSKRLFNDRFLAQFIPYEHRMRCLEVDDENDDDGDGHDDDEEEEPFPASICLCPKLEVLNSIDAVYSERILLEFLRSRSIDHRTHNVSHLHHASIFFKESLKPESVKEVEVIKKEMVKLGEDTGLAVELRYPIPLGPPAPPLFDDKSPFNGIQRTSTPLTALNMGFIKFVF